MSDNEGNDCHASAGWHPVSLKKRWKSAGCQPALARQMARYSRRKKTWQRRVQG